MSDLLNFDDDADNLFQPSEAKARPARNLDDIFGTATDGSSAGNNLDDVLVPSVKDDIFETKLSSPTKKKPATRNIDSLFGDVDDEPDFFKTETKPAPKVDVVEEDLLGDFLSADVAGQDSEIETSEIDLIDQFAKQTGSEVGNNDIDDPFGVSQSSAKLEPAVQYTQENNSSDTLEVQLKGSVSAGTDDLLTNSNQSNKVDQSELVEKSHGYESDHSVDSLDMLLNAQPEGTLPASDNLHSVVEPLISPDEPVTVSKASENEVTRKPVGQSTIFGSSTEDSARSFDTVDAIMQAQPVGMVPTTGEELFPTEGTVTAQEPDRESVLHKSAVTDILHDYESDHSADSLDILLNAQPEGTLPASDNLHSIIEPLLKTSAVLELITNSNNTVIEDKESGKSVQQATKSASFTGADKSLNTLDAVPDAQPIETLLLTSQSELAKESRVGSFSSEDKKLDESLDSLDLLLDAQPAGTVPATDDLYSVVAPITNTAASSNICPATTSDSAQDQKGDTTDLFGDDTEPVQEVTSEPEEQQDKEVEEGQEEPVKDSSVVEQKTNLKKSMERSFEDLLHGLSDESEPELDDMIDNPTDSTNLERLSHHQSLLGSPNKNIRDFKPDVSPSDFTSPEKSLDDIFDMDIVSSTPNEKSAESSKVKDTTPEVRVHTSDDEEVENQVEEETSSGMDRDGGDGVMEDLSEVVMRPKPGRALEDEDDLSLPDVGDTNYLDVDASKHKSALGKQGSLALRRKPSRKSRRSLLSAGEDAIFQDSTDIKPSDVPNGDAGIDNTDDTERLDLSPPAKKPSPAIMMPLPGMAGRPPSQRLSSSTPDDAEQESAMDIKESKRLSKPPPGAFVLPTPTSRPSKLQKPDTESIDKPPVESTPPVFEKPVLKTVQRVEKMDQDEDLSTGFSRAELRPTQKQEVDSRERDVTYQRPSLRSTPKTSDTTPEDKKETPGVFEKPVLRPTPKPKVDPKPRLSETEDMDVFDTKNLRSAQKPVFDAPAEPSADRHVFDKPSLRSTGKRPDSENNSITSINSDHGAKLFEKPALKTTERDARSESLTENNVESSHTFNKPSLRSASRTTSESQQSSHGTFEKPSLKKTTPSPEKEVKDSHEPKGIFDKPTLRKTRRVKDQEDKGSEKPEWLQEAANKHSKVLDALHAKENQQGHIEKAVPSWLEKTPLRKPRAQPLQDTSNGQLDSHSEDSLKEDSVKASTPRSRNSSMGSESEPEKARTSAAGSQNNYTPSWMRQQRATPGPSGIAGVSPSRSIPTQNISSEVPQWKLELAQRRHSTKTRTDETPVKEAEDTEPEWKKGLALRKTNRNVAPPTKEVHSVEPEWKKAAEEKRARLRSKSLQYPHLKIK